MVAEAVEGAPDVERLDTRALEQRALIRGFVRSAVVSAAGSQTTLVLRTVDGSSTTHTDWRVRECDQPGDTEGCAPGPSQLSLESAESV